MLDTLQKRICRAVGTSLASLESLAHLQNVASLSFFCRYYFSTLVFGIDVKVGRLHVVFV